MNKLQSNKAFQEILKNAPEMPINQNPETKLSSGNWGLLITLGCVALGQLLVYAALEKMKKDMMDGKFSLPPKI